MSLTITLLHGWAVSPENQSKWVQFRACLKRKGFDTRFLPIPGLSSPLDTAWGLQEYVLWLHAQLKHGKKTILLGHSFGGQIVSRFAALYPEKVSAVILIDSAGIRDRSIAVVIKRSVFKCIATLGKKLTNSPQLRHIIYKLAREKDYFEASPVLRRTMAAVLADEVTSDLPKISAPTCIIWGEHDRVTPPKLAYQFNALIPNSQLHIITGARHSPQFSHPTTVAEYIVAFLQAEFLVPGGKS